MLDRLPGPLRRLLYAGGTRSDRLRDPDVVVEALRVGPGMTVADLGPGYGHFTLRLARAVNPGGVVFALDASARTLDDLRQAADARGIANLRMVRVARDRLEVPEPVDLLFVSATYHHLRDRIGYFTAARAFLRPGARVAILEALGTGILARWMGLHASPPGQVLKEMKRAGYRLVETRDLVPGYLFGVFQVREPETDESPALSASDH
jgi:arsenite methyltransferase